MSNRKFVVAWPTYTTYIIYIFSSSVETFIDDHVLMVYWKSLNVVTFVGKGKVEKAVVQRLKMDICRDETRKTGLI